MTRQTIIAARIGVYPVTQAILGLRTVMRTSAIYDQYGRTYKGGAGGTSPNMNGVGGTAPGGGGQGGGVEVNGNNGGKGGSGGCYLYFY